MLRGAGYVSIESTTDPNEVCELHCKNRYDLILMDIPLPGMDGLAATALLNRDPDFDHLDCGWRDQYHLHYGARILSKRLAAAGIRHTYVEFDDDHSDVDYRMDASLPFLYKALQP